MAAPLVKCSGLLVLMLNVDILVVLAVILLLLSCVITCCMNCVGVVVVFAGR